MAENMYSAEPITSSLISDKREEKDGVLIRLSLSPARTCPQ